MLLILVAMVPGVVRAHADYERSSPAADAVVPEAPPVVEVWFTQELFRREGENSLEVYGPDGARVDQGDARIDDDDRTHLMVSLQPALPDGQYSVRWRNLSADDGHSKEGEFVFTVDSAASPAADVTVTVLPETPTVPATTTPTEVVATATVEPAVPAAAPSRALPCFGAMLIGSVTLIAAGARRSRG